MGKAGPTIGVNRLGIGVSDRYGFSCFDGIDIEQIDAITASYIETHRGFDLLCNFLRPTIVNNIVDRTATFPGRRSAIEGYG